MDINYRGTRRKVTIGKSFKELDDLCRKHNPKLYNTINEKVNEVNWRKMIKNHLKYYVSDVVNSISKEEFENYGQIVINPKTFKLQILTKKDEIEKIEYASGRITSQPNPATIRAASAAVVDSLNRTTISPGTDFACCANVALESAPTTMVPASSLSSDIGSSRLHNYQTYEVS